MEDCETGVLTDTICGAPKRDQELQGHCAHICIFKVVLFFVSKKKKNLSWKKLHVVDWNGISCQHLQNHLEWQED